MLKLLVNGEVVKEYENPVKRVSVHTKLGEKASFAVSPEEGQIELIVNTVGAGDVRRASDDLARRQNIEGLRREAYPAGERPVASVGPEGQDAPPLTALTPEETKDLDINVKTNEQAQKEHEATKARQEKAEADKAAANKKAADNK